MKAFLPCVIFQETEPKYSFTGTYSLFYKTIQNFYDWKKKAV